MIKKYWAPILMGAVTAVIGFLITYANLTIYLGVSAKTGMPIGYDGREIFISLCAALGGPLAALIAILQFPLIGLYMSLPAKGVAMVMLDRFAASMAVVFLYRFAYLRIKRLPLLFLFWAATIWAYYAISYNIELIFGSIFSGTSVLETYQRIGKGAILNLLYSLELPFTYVFTVLILLVIPPHFRKPFWVRPKRPAIEKMEVGGLL